MMILPTLANGLINGNYVLTRTNANVCELRTHFLGQPLKDVNNFKDLGVTITKDLSWSSPISITVNKANKVPFFVKRSVGTANLNVFFYALQISCTADPGICGTCLVSLPCQGHPCS